MEDNKEKTTDELLKENNELLKALLGKLGIIRTAAWLFVIGIVISVIVYLFTLIASCFGQNRTYNTSLPSDSDFVQVDSAVTDSDYVY